MTIVSQQGDRYSPYVPLQHRRIFGGRILNVTIVSQQGDRHSLYLLPITVLQDFWRLNTGCDHDIPMKRSPFTLSPITAPRNFFRGGLTIDRWT
ncbi:hypothetical protein [Cylindrospermopsis raciborskii]|uniref:hypothetical protein n=1 Tax=Cylindrospermopsis raciborskii TaxID=77022 RepID=UPI00117888EC|nr:hypothetical protein [Cylindrospermopsis raciborskii]